LGFTRKIEVQQVKYNVETESNRGRTGKRYKESWHLLGSNKRGKNHGRQLFGRRPRKEKGGLNKEEVRGRPKTDAESTRLSILDERN